MNFLVFALAAAGDGVHVLEAMASTRAEQHPAVMAEVTQVLDWAWQHFADAHGPLEDGMDWHHDLQVVAEDGGWQTLSLTIGASDRFIHAFQQAFGPLDDAC